MIKVYEYKGCSTCQKAMKFLEKNKIKCDRKSIVDQPPTINELKKMLKFLKAGGETFKKLFNTSGVQYRELKIADKIKGGMTEEEALKLLETNGKLIKRPFLLTDKGGTVGFNADVWSELL